MDVPTIFNYTEYRGFFTEILEANRRRRPSFSLRLVSRKLRWPVSLLSEVLSGKRKLTIARALEMGSYLGLNPRELDYLVFLVLKDHQNPKVHDYFERKLEGVKPKVAETERSSSHDLKSQDYSSAISE